MILSFFIYRNMQGNGLQENIPKGRLGGKAGHL